MRTTLRLNQARANNRPARNARRIPNMRTNKKNQKAAVASVIAKFITIGPKGTFCFSGLRLAEGKIAPTRDCDSGESAEFSGIVPGKDILADWSTHRMASAVQVSLRHAGAWVARKGGRVIIMPLDAALKEKLVARVPAWTEKGESVSLVLPSAWTPADKLPQVCGTDSVPFGRFEPHAHPDKVRRSCATYAQRHQHLSLTAPVKAK